MHLETRLSQLDSAISMELWQVISTLSTNSQDKPGVPKNLKILSGLVMSFQLETI